MSLVKASAIAPRRVADPDTTTEPAATVRPLFTGLRSRRHAVDMTGRPLATVTTLGRSA